MCFQPIFSPLFILIQCTVLTQCGVLHVELKRHCNPSTTCKVSTRNQILTQHEKNLITEITDYTVSCRSMTGPRSKSMKVEKKSVVTESRGNRSTNAFLKSEIQYLLGHNIT